MCVSVLYRSGCSSERNWYMVSEPSAGFVFLDLWKSDRNSTRRLGTQQLSPRKGVFATLVTLCGNEYGMTGAGMNVSNKSSVPKKKTVRMVCGAAGDFDSCAQILSRCMFTIRAVPLQWEMSVHLNCHIMTSQPSVMYCASEVMNCKCF